MNAKDLYYSIIPSNYFPQITVLTDLVSIALPKIHLGNEAGEDVLRLKYILSYTWKEGNASIIQI